MNNCKINNFEYMRNNILGIYYTILFLLEIVSTGFIINKMSDIIEITSNNNTFIEECKYDKLNSFNHGKLYYNTVLLFISLICVMSVISIYILYQLKINRKKLEYNQELIYNDNNDNKIKFILGIILLILCIVYYILNITQFIYQLYDIDIDCIKIINNNIDNFNVIYSILQCATSFIIISIIFLFPLFR